MSRFLGLLIPLAVFLNTLQVEGGWFYDDDDDGYDMHLDFNVPSEERPGACPKPRLSMFSGRCYRDDCRYDQDCPDHMKCCYTGCRYQCRSAIPLCEPRCRSSQVCKWNNFHQPVCVNRPLVCRPPCKQNEYCTRDQYVCLALSCRPRAICVSNVCNLPKKVGPCKYRKERWYYNVVTNQCVKFYYGGCGGNGNNYNTKAECVKKCVDICKLPKKPGPCRGSFNRWYFNGMRCVKFTYGGCKGNTNNFGSIAECEKKCMKDICKLPKKPGHCKGTSNRWYFNGMKCEMFIYGLCQGNANNFKTIAECEKRCMKDICKLPKKPGPCKGTSNRWYFNGKKCEMFIYGLCQGNANNFKTIAECEKRCMKDICKLPKKPGPCRGSFNRWYFNGMRCVKFTYGGCKGNANNFGSITQCEKKCMKDICKLPKKPGPCKGTSNRWYFNGMKCEKFIYGLCQGNANNFKTIAECEKRCMKDICKLPKKPGPCRGSFNRWYFNGMRCVKFTYGGCKGNANNFMSIAQCEKKCMKDICKLPKKPGHCKGTSNRWYFNGMKCEMFIYGLCQGNANNFKTIAECEKRCMKDICKLPKKPGPCKGTSNRWYFNGMKCEMFIYGLCQGNANNFKTIAECEKRCMKDICKLPKKPGPCRGSFNRWYFNGMKCVKFTYGGCKGNANNFKTIAECEKKCMKDICKLPKKPGPCKGTSNRWYFNGMKCEMFIYGLCQGNANNFKTIAECEKKCMKDICKLPKKPGPCFGKLTRWQLKKYTRWYFNGMRCVKFKYGGCKGNANNFMSIVGCEKKCMKDFCKLPVKPGPCRGSFNRWYFNGVNCVKFTYGGCKGNANNFMSLAECQKRCVKDICKLPKKPGPCRGSFNRWFFNGMKCVKFTYGGCQSNANNFKSIVGCEKKCMKDICKLPVKPGPCRGSFNRWYFNGMNCVKFTYGGCKGNANNFGSTAECEKKCMKEICKLPVKPGPCRGSSKRWYFNGMKCVMFIYGGCKGNANSFGSITECEKNCMKDICELPKKPGPCRGSFNRWYFNGMRCVKFTYGGCKGNANNFMSIVECEKKCMKDMCKLPAKHGPCIIPFVMIQRFYFNGMKCMKFTYGGCKGNANNFGSIAECEKRCMKDMCKLPKKPGPCKGTSNRWYFNGMKCVKFTYGGCKGNANNFGSIVECEKECVNVFCKLPKKRGPCKGSFNRWYFNGMNCEKFTYGGCKGNANNFMSTAECEKKCMKDFCKLPKKYGVCSGYHNRWYFNGMKCVKFTYSGCHGNANNFMSIAECEKKCMKAGSRRGRCPVLPPGTIGTCVNLCNRDTDCPKPKKCCSNGCGRVCKSPVFTTPTCASVLCRKGTVCKIMPVHCLIPPCLELPKCVPISPDICERVKKVGPCKARKKRWYYDGVNFKCVMFYYGGCQSNGNNFKTKAECEKKCGSNICKRGKHVGPCKARMIRWYHIVETDQCAIFYYGGCQSNGNNFKTKAACEKKCGKPSGVTRPGQCPELKSGTVGACVHMCSRDGDCPAPKKCCLNGCGTVCRKPVTCANVRCRSGTVCRMLPTGPKCFDPCKPPKTTRKNGIPRTCLTVYLPRWIYKGTKCVLIHHGPCKGEENVIELSFPTKAACEKMCVKKPSGGSRPGSCPKLKPGTVGACVQKCSKDTDCPAPKKCCSNGCGRVCTKPAGSSGNNVCKLPKVSGRCKAYMPSWYFDGTACKRFIYGGCGGNANRFTSKAECEKTCP